MAATTTRMAATTRRTTVGRRASSSVSSSSGSSRRRRGVGASVRWTGDADDAAARAGRWTTTSTTTTTTTGGWRRRGGGRGGEDGRETTRRGGCDRASVSTMRPRAIYNASWDGFDVGDDDEEEDEVRAAVARATTVERWLGYAGALALNLGLGTLFCWSIYLVPLEQGLGVGRATLSSVFSLSTIATVSAMSAAGPWVYATYGASRVAAFAAAFAACGLWTASFAMQFRAVWPLYVGYGLMFGFASGLGYGLSVQVAPYAPLSAGLATGLVTSARAAGAFMFAPLVKAVVFSSGPQVALSMLGNYMAAATIPIFALFNAAKLTMPLAKKRDKTSVTLAEMERDIKLRPLIRVLWLCMATGLFSGLMVMSHGATVLSSRGLSAQVLIGGVSIVSAMTSAGRIFGGWICDRVAPKRVLVITPLLSVAPLIWASVDKSSILAGELALASAALVYGMFASTIPVEVRRVAGADDFARTYGRIFTAWGLSGLAAPYVAGLFYDAYGDYSFALNCAAVLSCVSACVAALLESPSESSQ